MRCFDLISLSFNVSAFSEQKPLLVSSESTLKDARLSKQSGGIPCVASSSNQCLWTGCCL